MEASDFIGPAATIIVQLAKYRSCKKPPFILQRINDRGVRKIRLFYVTKNMEKCMIFFETTPLLWDRLKVNRTQKTIGEGGGGNVVIPDEIFDENATVTVLFDGQKVVRKYLDLVEADP
ncbi:MAG: hypothetical protein QXJ74_05475 [Nitrososphaera sp.]